MARKKSPTATPVRHPDCQVWLTQHADWQTLYGNYDKSSQGLEPALELLEMAAPLLERPEIPLDDLLLIYEKTIALTRSIQATLAVAQQRVEVLSHAGAGSESAEVDDVDA